MVFGSLRKGHKFENVIAKWLSKKTNVQWQRVLSSGGYGTIHDINSFRGDVFTEANLYANLVIECKDHNKHVNLQDFNNPKSDLNQWITQTKTEAKERPWLLFLHWNRSPIFIVAANADVVNYVTQTALKPILEACMPVCNTSEYAFLQVKEE